MRVLKVRGEALGFRVWVLPSLEQGEMRVLEVRGEALGLGKQHQ
jgi:hypothetical protein